jgi:iron complex outermembrane receptor protein
LLKYFAHHHWIRDDIGQPARLPKLRGGAVSKQNNTSTGIIVFLTLSAAAAVAEQAPAQPNARSSTQSSEGILTEIVVTAEKRESTVQKTPVSVTAISGEDLLARGLTSAQDLVQAAPGIAVASAGPGQALYEIRGLSSSGGGESPTIGFYLDDIPITPPAGAATGKSEIDPDLFDLERVEVLRGPQGTLYGSGSLGGTVKLVTKPPDFAGFYGSTESTVSGTHGGGLNAGEKAMINVPLVADTIALRVVAGYTHDSGWIARIVVPDFPLESNGGLTRGNVLALPASIIHNRVNDEHTSEVRAGLLIKPTEALTIKGSVFYQRITQGGMNAYDSVPGTLAHYQPFDIAEPFSDQFTVSSVVVNYDFDRFMITSVSGYQTRKSSQIQDASEAIQDAYGLPAFDVAAGGIGPVQASETDTSREFTQELRLASSSQGRFQWIVGGFFSSYSYNIGTGAPYVPGLLALAGTTTLDFVTAPLTIKQEAGFAHASYELSRSLKLEVGARYFSYQNNSSSSAVGLVFGGGPVINSSSASDSGVNPMINLSYSPTSALMFYASASEGFREGAGNFPVPTTGTIGSMCLAGLKAIGLSSSPSSYAPDTDWSYELGEKGRFFDGRVTLNADVFYTLWSKVQTPVALSCGIGFTTNGPDAKVKGGEIELQVQLARDLTLSQSVGFANAAYSENFAAAAVVKGAPLFDAPRWTISSSLRYERPIGPFSLFGQVQNSYQSHSFDLSYKINNVPSRDLTNLRFGLETKRWSASVFANNVFNVHAALENLNLLTATGPSYNRVATNQPLTAGVELGVTF